MWTYRANSEHAEDGFILISPANREVGLIHSKPDTKSICELLNEALLARLVK